MHFDPNQLLNPILKDKREREKQWQTNDAILLQLMLLQCLESLVRITVVIP